MSYSFTVTAANKADAKQQIEAQLTKIVGEQPVHAADKDAAIATANACVDTLADPGENNEVLVSMNGSLGWQDAAAKEFNSASISVSASLRWK